MATTTAAGVRAPRVRASAPALVTAGLTVLFLLVAAWWLAADERIPDFDSGKHMLFALQFNSAWAQGDLFAPFTDFTAYPPLVHMVGALGLRVGGIDPTAPVLAAAIVFVPLLTWSLYRLGALLESPLAGALAAGFALGTPMVAAQFHAFMLEAPETALVALSLWCLVASRRFADVRWSVAAGVACGLGRSRRSRSSSPASSSCCSPAAAGGTGAGWPRRRSRSQASRCPGTSSTAPTSTSRSPTPTCRPTRRAGRPPTPRGSRGRT